MNLINGDDAVDDEVEAADDATEVAGDEAAILLMPACESSCFSPPLIRLTIAGVTRVLSAAELGEAIGLINGGGTIHDDDDDSVGGGRVVPSSGGGSSEAMEGSLIPANAARGRLGSVKTVVVAAFVSGGGGTAATCGSPIASEDEEDEAGGGSGSERVAALTAGVIPVIASSRSSGGSSLICSMALSTGEEAAESVGMGAAGTGEDAESAGMSGAGITAVAINDGFIAAAVVMGRGTPVGNALIGKGRLTAGVMRAYCVLTVGAITLTGG